MQIVEDRAVSAPSMFEGVFGLGSCKAKQLATLALSIFFLLAAVTFALHYSASNSAPGESGLAAENFLRTGTIGNPYLLPTGPTAHVSPVLVLYLASVFALFGANTLNARIALSILAGICYAASCFLTLRICARYKRVYWAAYLLILAFPLFLFLDTVQARQWDQPYSSLLVISAWSLMSSRPSRRIAPIISMAALCGFGVLLSPSLIPCLLSALALMIWRWRRFIPLLTGSFIAAALLLAFLLPWGIRNEEAFGKFIVTRSDFFLEFAVGNAKGANGITGSGSGGAFHPHDSRPAALEMAKVGELKYMEEMRSVSLKEVSQDPVRFVENTLRRIFFSIMPPPELLAWCPPYGHFAGYVLALYGCMHLFALGLTLLSRRAAFYGLNFTVLPMAAYWTTHINFRYLAVTYFPTVILIAWAGAMITSSFGTSRATADREARTWQHVGEGHS